jgi:hypothetical protein
MAATSGEDSDSSPSNFGESLSQLNEGVSEINL